MFIDPNPVKLDISHWKQKGLELHKAIEGAVGDTQAWLFTTLPNQLHMTQEQFLDLEKTSNMQEMHDFDEFGRITSSTDRLYMTKYNVMECKVVEK